MARWVRRRTRSIARSFADPADPAAQVVEVGFFLQDAAVDDRRAPAERPVEGQAVVGAVAEHQGVAAACRSIQSAFSSGRQRAATAFGRQAELGGQRRHLLRAVAAEDVDAIAPAAPAPPAPPAAPGRAASAKRNRATGTARAGEDRLGARRPARRASRPGRGSRGPAPRRSPPPPPPRRRAARPRPPARRFQQALADRMKVVLHQGRGGPRAPAPPRRAQGLRIEQHRTLEGQGARLVEDDLPHAASFDQRSFSRTKTPRRRSAAVAISSARGSASPMAQGQETTRTAIADGPRRAASCGREPPAEPGDGRQRQGCRPRSRGRSAPRQTCRQPARSAGASSCARSERLQGSRARSRAPPPVRR